MNVEKKQATVKLTSKDGDSFIVPIDSAQLSQMVKDILDEDEEGGSMVEVPLPNVKSQVLKKVIEFCEHHLTEPMTTIEKPLKSQNMKEIVQQWYVDFVDVDQALLFELVLAANYMDIKPLLNLTCATVASMIKGKSPEEIRTTFNMKNAVSPKEEAQVREENQLAEEHAQPSPRASLRTTLCCCSCFMSRPSKTPLERRSEPAATRNSSLGKLFSRLFNCFGARGNGKKETKPEEQTESTETDEASLPSVGTAKSHGASAVSLS